MKEQEEHLLTTQSTDEPSQSETAVMIADQLEEKDERRRRYIISLVRILGRTQAREYCAETLEHSTLAESEGRTKSEIFFELACTKGKPKPGKVLKPFQEHPKLPSRREMAKKIAERLNETKVHALQQIHHIVWALGIVQAWALTLEALEIDEGEGMMVPDGSRRRTVGGVFFYLAYTKGVPEPEKELKRLLPKKPRTDQAEEQKEAIPRPVPVIALSWQDRIEAISEAEQRKGNATVKITLVGRPGKIVDRGQCIITVVEASKVPALPKGVPVPPTLSTRYTVYIASKQWKKVAESIQDPEDVLIVEGFPSLDAQVKAIAVFATNVSTKKLQIAQKTKQQKATT